MKTLCLAAAASCLMAMPIAAAPFPAASAASPDFGPGAAIEFVAMGDDPAARPRRGGGGHRHKAAAATSAGTPKLENGETAESAQKAYQKKYGF